jgi:hypothetical protein
MRSEKRTRKERTMNDFFLRRAVNLVVLVLVAVVLLVSGTIANAVEPKLDDDWHFIFIP